MSGPNLCIHCFHCEKVEPFLKHSRHPYLCKNPIYVSPVTGETDGRACDDERAPGGPCGPDGLHFVDKRGPDRVG